MNLLCHALNIECSICHDQFERGNTSGTTCQKCKELIQAIKEWKLVCQKCRQYLWIDLCPTCLNGIAALNPPLAGCNIRHHNLFNVCTECLKEFCKTEFNGQDKPHCVLKPGNCPNSIDPNGCCGYPTGLCKKHNKELKKAILEHKTKCKANCKCYPFLDICPTCLELINASKSEHTDCFWKDSPYNVYVPCATCLACYACE